MVSRSTPGEWCNTERHNGKWMNRDARGAGGWGRRAFGVKWGEGIGDREKRDDERCRNFISEVPRVVTLLSPHDPTS